MQGKTSTQQLKEYLETKQGKTYFIAILTMITVAVMLVFAVVPATKSITDKIAQNRVRRDYLEALTAKEEALKNLLVEEEVSQDKILLLEQSLPSSRNDEYVLANINELAKTTNNTIVAADYGEAGPAKFTTQNPNAILLRQVPITLTVQGSISSLGEFLKKVEEFPTVLAVESISLSNRNVRSMNLPSSRGDTVLSVKFNYYYYVNATE